MNLKRYFWENFQWISSVTPRINSLTHSRNKILKESVEEFRKKCQKKLIEQCLVEFLMEIPRQLLENPRRDSLWIFRKNSVKIPEETSWNMVKKY